jgi:hypothetical protein
VILLLINRDAPTSGTIVGKTYGDLLKGISIINSTFFNAIPRLYEQLPPENITSTEVGWQPIGAHWMESSVTKGGNALGLDSERGVYICYTVVVLWTGSEYDDVVYSWLEDVISATKHATEAAGLYDPFNYM